ncbi:MAG TPA: SCO family protein [Polyangia bacterium]|nr:SCO family protein [Polyangia bacterium]
MRALRLGDRFLDPGTVARSIALGAAVLAAGVWLGHRLDPTWAEAGGGRWAPGRVADFAATDQDGRAVSRADLAGHRWVADFIFTSCAGICPTLTARLAALRRRVADPAARFVSFSIDPDRDTPAVLQAYAARWGPRDPRWRLLHADAATLARVAASLGARGAGGLHNDRFFLVDDAGFVRGGFASGDPGIGRWLEGASPPRE